MQVGGSNLRASTSMDAPGSSGLQFELNNLRNELRAKQREHSETEEEVEPYCRILHSTPFLRQCCQAMHAELHSEQLNTV